MIRQISFFSIITLIGYLSNNLLRKNKEDEKFNVFKVRRNLNKLYDSYQILFENDEPKKINGKLVFVKKDKDSYIVFYNNAWVITKDIHDIINNIVLIGAKNNDPYPFNSLSKLIFKAINYEQISFYHSKKLDRTIITNKTKILNKSNYNDLQFIKSKYFKKSKKDNITLKILSSEFHILNKKNKYGYIFKFESIWIYRVICYDKIKKIFNLAWVLTQHDPFSNSYLEKPLFLSFKENPANTNFPPKTLISDDGKKVLIDLDI